MGHWTVGYLALRTVRLLVSQCLGAVFVKQFGERHSSCCLWQRTNLYGIGICSPKYKSSVLSNKLRSDAPFTWFGTAPLAVLSHHTVDLFVVRLLGSPL